MTEEQIKNLRLEKRMKNVMDRINQLMNEKKKDSFIMKVKRTKPKTQPKGWS